MNLLYRVGCHNVALVECIVALGGSSWRIPGEAIGFKFDLKHDLLHLLQARLSLSRIQMNLFVSRPGRRVQSL